MSETNSKSSIELAVEVAKVLDENKAENVTILNMENVNTYLSVFVLCTSLTDSHAKKLTYEAEQHCRLNDYPIVYPEKIDYSSGWVVLDFGPLVIHIFNRENRAFYNLENLWKNAQVIDWR